MTEEFKTELANKIQNDLAQMASQMTVEEHKDVSTFLNLFNDQLAEMMVNAAAAVCMEHFTQQEERIIKVQLRVAKVEALLNQVRNKWSVLQQFIRDM